MQPGARVHFQRTAKQARDAFQAALCFPLMEVAHTSAQAKERRFFDVTQWWSLAA